MENDKQHLQEITDYIAKLGTQLGFRISTDRSEVMSVEEDRTEMNITCNNIKLKQVPTFTYLGSCIDNEGLAEKDVKIRIGKANAVFKKLRKTWKTKSLSLKIKIRLFTSIVNPHFSTLARIGAVPKLSAID